MAAQVSSFPVLVLHQGEANAQVSGFTVLVLHKTGAPPAAPSGRRILTIISS
jgi:hypothetical protein